MGVFIIAEAGVNHNGNTELAKKLIDVAVSAGCDAVKFQTFKAGNMITRTAKKAEYQSINMGTDESQYQMLKRLELSDNVHVELLNYCKNSGIIFLSTPFDQESADMLFDLGMPIFKIPSGEITNKPLIKHIAAKQRPIILSTGMSRLAEVEEALEWIYEENNKEVTLLHCTTDYPTQVCEVNLRSMITMKEAFKTKVGYSDHTLGIEIPCAAVALGAEIIEKHFTVDRGMDGPDHKASLEPDELILMVKSIRNIEAALGDGIKRPTKNEKKNLDIARKSIVAAVKIEKGEVITIDKLAVKRPGNGIPPKKIGTLLNKVAARTMEEDHVISFGDFL